MGLKWTDYLAIAEKLEEHHSETDRLNITDEQVRQLVVALPDFDDTPTPPDAEALQAITMAWLSLEEDDGDRQWDAYV